MNDMYSEVYYAMGNMKVLDPTFMMTNYRSDSEPQNNDLATQRTQDKDNSFGFEITLLVDGMEIITSTVMESGLLLRISIFLRSAGVSDQETINCIKIHRFKENSSYCQPKST